MAEAAAGNTTDAGSTPAPKGVLKTGRYTSGGTKKSSAGRRGSSPVRRARLFDEHTYEHPDVYFSAGLLLTEDDKYTEYTTKLRDLFTEMRVVDKKVRWEPKDPEDLSARVERAEDISTNITVLGATVVAADNAVFEKVRNKGYKKPEKGQDAPLQLDDGDGPEGGQQPWKDPVVWFTFKVATDKDPEELARRTRDQWSRIGGRKLELKAIESFEEESAVVLYRVLVDQDQDTLVDELDRMMTAARDTAAEEDAMFEYALMDVPEISLRPYVPKIPGLDPRKYKDWDWRKQNLRKALHVVCARKDVQQVQTLIRCAKEFKVVERAWGKNVALSDVIVTGKQASNKREGKGEQRRTGRLLAKRCVQYASKHILYQESMTADGLTGLTSIDEPVPIYSASDPERKEGSLTMRAVLYQYVRMADGRSLFAEIHQAVPSGPVDVVVGRCKEAEDMIAQLNDNIAAYLTFVLRAQGVSDQFLRELLRRSCDPSLVLEVSSCSWDEEAKRLVTPRTKDADAGQALEEAAWYSKIEGSLMGKKGKEKEKNHLAPEDIYDLDQDQSVTTLHSRRGRSGGSPGAPPVDLGFRGRDTSIPRSLSRRNMDEVSVLSETSRGEVTEALKDATKEDLVEFLKYRKGLSTTQGSAPNPGFAKSRSAYSDDSSSSSSSEGSSMSSTAGDSGPIAQAREDPEVASATRKVKWMTHGKGSTAGSASNRSGAGCG